MLRLIYCPGPPSNSRVAPRVARWLGFNTLFNSQSTKTLRCGLIPPHAHGCRNPQDGYNKEEHKGNPRVAKYLVEHWVVLVVDMIYMDITLVIVVGHKFLC